MKNKIVDHILRRLVAYLSVRQCKTNIIHCSRIGNHACIMLKMKEDDISLISHASYFLTICYFWSFILRKVFKVSFTIIDYDHFVNNLALYKPITWYGLNDAHKNYTCYYKTEFDFNKYLNDNDDAIIKQNNWYMLTDLAYYDNWLLDNEIDDLSGEYLLQYLLSCDTVIYE